MLITALTQSIEYLAGRSRLVYALMGLYYKSIIRQEAHLAGISSKDKILCIGGGPCPYTAILLHKLTGAPVTVIDNNRFCVQKSLGLIKRLNLQDEIKVLCSEGENIDCHGFSVIHLAMQISPKEKVLKRLLGDAQEGAKILVRMPKPVVKGLYCNISCNPFSKGCVAHHLFANIDSTALFVKEGFPFEAAF